MKSQKLRNQLLKDETSLFIKALRKLTAEDFKQAGYGEADVHNQASILFVNGFIDNTKYAIDIAYPANLSQENPKAVCDIRVFVNDECTADFTIFDYKKRKKRRSKRRSKKETPLTKSPQIVNG